MYPPDVHNVPPLFLVKLLRVLSTNDWWMSPVHAVCSVLGKGLTCTKHQKNKNAHLNALPQAPLREWANVLMY